MNRFEALHALGLDDKATDEDIRLAYYGIRKVTDLEKYKENTHIYNVVDRMLDHVRQSHNFLLSSFKKSAARGVGAGKRTKVSVTHEGELKARLHGWEQLRLTLVGYYEKYRTQGKFCILALILCIIISFLVLRFKLPIPMRVSICILLAIVAVAASTILTIAIRQGKDAKKYVVDADESIHRLKVELGLEKDENAEVAPSNVEETGTASEAEDQEELDDEFEDDDDDEDEDE